MVLIVTVKSTELSHHHKKVFKRRGQSCPCYYVRQSVEANDQLHALATLLLRILVQYGVVW